MTGIDKGKIIRHSLRLGVRQHPRLTGEIEEIAIPARLWCRMFEPRKGSGKE